ncbi:hypothetical protein [Actinomadura sp. DC4]|uniref:hypothetical protein n=1 Tax=Actinomadura sp. DC4 TaxID=3055069 RepID=UPI0025B0D797|nr:hypothetical protein [Actinomadura sp. DC4]
MTILTDPRSAAPSRAPETPPPPRTGAGDPAAPVPAGHPPWLVPAFCGIVGLSVLLAAVGIRASVGDSSHEGTRVSVGTSGPTLDSGPTGSTSDGDGGSSVDGDGDGTDSPAGGTPDSPAEAASGDGGVADSANASDQATAFNELLESSAATRKELPGDLQTCDGVSGAIGTLEQVIGERESQLSRAQSLTVDALEGGEDLRTSLVTALEDSLRADRAYLAWANTVQGCTGDAPTDDSDHAEAAQADEDAGDAKDDVVSAWRPIADQFGLPTHGDGMI